MKASDELSKNFDVLFLRLCCYKEVVDVHENGFPFQIADDAVNEAAECGAGGFQAHRHTLVLV